MAKPIQRYFVRIAYDGSSYHGWQRQPNAISVQEVIESQLSTLFQENITIVGCGRTDTGVHASDYVFHFDQENQDPIDSEQFVFKINCLLPDDIVVYSLDPVSQEYHARFSAISRAYEYRISLKKPLFDRNFVHPWRGNKSDISLTQLQKISTALKDYQEWKPFTKTNSDVNNYRVRIQEMSWIENLEQKEIIFRIKADRFLRGMVRLLVGAHIRIVEGKMTLDELLSAMDTQSLLNQAYSAPAKGLTLTEVLY